MLRRAFKVASTDPGGPVYLATAQAALRGQKRVRLDSAGRAVPAAHACPRRSTAIDQAARMLAEAKRRLVIAGDEVFKSSASKSFSIWQKRSDSPWLALNLALPRSRGFCPPSLNVFESRGTSYAKSGINLILISASRRRQGCRAALAELPPDARGSRLSIDTSAMGRNYPTDVALISDVKAGLTDLRASVNSMLTQDRRAAIAKARSEEVRRTNAEFWAQNEKEISVSLGKSPVHPRELGRTLAETLDKNAIVVSENLTGTYESFRFGFREDEQMWLGTSGSSLGWGIGAASGAKLAAPDRQVVCSIGDGSVMYSASGFWTQARYSIPVMTVVWNNHNYQTVRHAYYEYQGRMVSSGKYAGMYLGNPDIDFVKLAGSQGLAGERVSSGSDLKAAFNRGIAATRDGKPYLVEVVIARYGGGAESTWHESFNLASRRKRQV